MLLQSRPQARPTPHCYCEHKSPPFHPLLVSFLPSLLPQYRKLTQFLSNVVWTTSFRSTFDRRWLFVRTWSNRCVIFAQRLGFHSFPLCFIASFVDVWLINLYPRLVVIVFVRRPRSTHSTLAVSGSKSIDRLSIVFSLETGLCFNCTHLWRYLCFADRQKSFWPAVVIKTIYSIHLSRPLSRRFDATIRKSCPLSKKHNLFFFLFGVLSTFFLIFTICFLFFKNIFFV